ncbi:IroE protein [Bacillus manliponensis]|uniref:IroE protein n=1 Tax=Bacillus manliponensis TaxID=574376 RepID=A0A073JTL9_9BACI|nr:IroE protein [Bacillus manliponensis]
MKEESAVKNLAVGVEHWTMIGKENGRTYEIYVSNPKQPAPPSGYPVIYVLDGNAYFQLFKDAVKIQSVRSEKTGVTPAIVVGIGYPSEDHFSSEDRVYDFTLPALQQALPKRPDGSGWSKTGGADEFFCFIEEELKQKVEECFPIDKMKQTIFGHSLGGLFSLYTLFAKTEAFQTYFICSPSIWWNNEAVLEKEAQFIETLQHVENEIGVFLTVEGIGKDHMYRDAKALSERLLALKHSKLRLEFHGAEEENHASVVPTMLSRALRFISNQ